MVGTEQNEIDWKVGLGVAVRHYLTQDGKEADYVLFVNRQSVGIIVLPSMYWTLDKINE